VARHLFGDSLADWAFTEVDGVDGVDDLVQVAAGATITLWNARTGGTQITDLEDTTGSPIDHVLTSDGTDGRAPGSIPAFYADDDRWMAWAAADGGPRTLMVTSDVGSVLGPLVDTINLTLTAHQGAANPHGTDSRDLVDFSPTLATAGQVPVFDGSVYVPATVEGLDPGLFVATDGGSTITIPEGNVDTRALQIRLPSGDRSAAVNTITVYWNSGSSGAPVWVETFRVGPSGELILQPSAVGKVPLEVRQFSGSQTANLTTWATSAGVSISYVDSAGRVRAPNLGITPSWSIDTATVVTGEYRQYNLTGVTLQLRGFLVSAGGQVPTGSSLIIDPKLDGVAVYSSPNRPTIAAGGRSSGLAASLATTAWPALSYLTVDVVQVGSTLAGTKIHIQGLAY
jgi:hypothetical protein